MRRKPRIFRRICTSAWLSHSRIGFATSRRKWWPQYRWGTPGQTRAMVVTNASCLSEIRIRTRQPGRSAPSLAGSISGRICSVALDESGLANQMRACPNSLTTSSVA